MERPRNREAIQVLRGLLVLRWGLIVPFLLIATGHSCTPSLTLTTVILLLLMAGLPTLGYLFRRDLLVQQKTQVGITIADFVLTSVLNGLLVHIQEKPLFFPLFILVSVEAACWLHWYGSMTSGFLGGVVLYLQYMTTFRQDTELWMIAIGVTMVWGLVLGYFAQRLLGTLWQTSDRLAYQENALRQSQDQLSSWQTIWNTLSQKGSLQALLDTALSCALEGTGSTLGLIALRRPYEEDFCAQCWKGFALTSPSKTSFHKSETLPGQEDGRQRQVFHLLKAPLQAASLSSVDEGLSLLGWITVARDYDHPYQDSEKTWLHTLSGYTTVLVENLSLQGQLGQIRHETDGIAQASWTLAALPNPTDALEMACRRILSTFDLAELVLLLYGGIDRSGSLSITYPADGPARTATKSLQGRGLRLLRKFLDTGTPLIVNRRGEFPELFEAMGWDHEIQAVACFPLVALHRRWGAICLLARVPGPFRPQTQQRLEVFTGEIAMALENFYLRRQIADSAHAASSSPTRPDMA